MAANTKVIDVKNVKGEVVAEVRGTSLFDAQYIAGVPEEYITGSTQTARSSLSASVQTTKLAAITKVSEKT